MRNRYFEQYGTLKWLDPDDFWSGGWVYVGLSTDEDGEQWDIVGHGNETRYSVV